MDTITLDMETFYSKEYSLRKMQTDEYVLDPRFQVIMVSVAINDEEPVVHMGGPDLLDTLWQYDWANSAVRCHNTLFDGFILTQVFGIRPKLWKDTLSQARMVFPWLKSHSLANLAIHLGLQEKGTAVHNMIGKRLEDLTEQETIDYSVYCSGDVEICRALGDYMDARTPVLEFAQIDMTIRMFTEPAFLGDVELMEKLYHAEVLRKEELLAQAAVDKTIIMSGDKLAAALLALGVVAPRKISARTGKEAYAFAKTDKAFKALLEHGNPEVQALVAARLGVKSTIAETRALRFWNMAKRGKLPVYLNFWGAKTTGRYSGGDKCLVGDSVIHVLRRHVLMDIMLSALLPSDLVWDGEAFVEHGGLVYQGEREVMEYQNVRGTPDHKVYCEHLEEPVELRVAAERGLMLRAGSRPDKTCLMRQYAHG